MCKTGPCMEGTVEILVSRRFAARPLTLALVLCLSGAIASGQSGSTKPLPQAKVLSGGVLHGWSGRFMLIGSPPGEFSLKCRDPLVLSKDRSIVCAVSPVNDGPLLIGADGQLSGWEVEVGGDSKFHCKDPSLDFSRNTIACPAQSRSAEEDLKAELRKAKIENALLSARLQDARKELRTPAISTEPLTITVATPRAHAFACIAPVLDPSGHILTCYEVDQLF